MRDQPAAPVDAAAARRFLTFRLTGALYALPAEYVLEVIHIPAVARVPHSPPSLLGIANLRGAVLPLVGLRELLGADARPAAAATATKAIVLDAGTHLALAVDSVDGLVAVAEDRIEVRESDLGAEHGEVLRGAFRSESHDAVVKILDIEKLLGAAFAQQTRTRRQPGSGKSRGGDTQRSAADAAATMLVTFEVAGQEFALDLDAVQEILPAPAVVMAVPRAEALVLGVTSVRDRLLPLLSLRGLLGFPPANGSDGREKVVVMRVNGAQVGLVADRARAILAAPPSAIDAVPPVLAARTGGEARLKAIYRGDDGRRLVSILMPEQLFREDVMRRLGHDAQNERGSAVPADSPRAEQTFLVFRLGEDEFGLPIEAVDEVGEVPEKITRLPKTPKFLEGVVNLRGDVLPVVDQRRRFDMPASSQTERRRLVVVRTELHRAGLIVDSVSDVLRVSGNAVEEAPALTDEIARLVRGVINLEQSKRMVLVLDPGELLTAAERGRLDAFQKGEPSGCVIKVLVVDDSALVRKLFRRVLGREHDLEVRVARNGLEALREIEEFQPAVVTLDIHMPQMGGLECLDRIMVERPCPVVMVSSLTAEGAEETLEALRLGAVDFVLKPEGAVSLRIDEFAPTLVAKIRAAAAAKIKKSARLRERVLHRTRPRDSAPTTRHKRRTTRASGDGLVLVGTSTGGPPALEALLVPLPQTFPWPILVAQHMPATFTGPLARRLDQLCELRVIEVLQPLVVEPGCVYIGRGDADLIVTRRPAGLTVLGAPAQDYPWHPSTDRLVRSALAHVPPQQLIGVLMTGMGNDGAEAMATLSQLGGTTIAESEETAVVWGMPGELVRAGAADWIEPVHKIASRLLKITPNHAARS